MSKIALTPNASGTGVFTISSPATSTDRTLTLPDEAGTLLTSASTANFPAGSVLQVVALTNSTRVVLPASADYWGSFGTITKISATSKLVVSGTFSGFIGANGSCGVGIRINTLYRYGNFTYEENTDSKNYAINADFGVMSVGVHTVYWGWKTFNGVTAAPFARFNPNSSDDSRQQQTTSVIIVTEVEA